MSAFRSAWALREQLVVALIAIFRNADAEIGVTWETPRSDELHRRYYALAAQTPWWARIGVWRQANRRYERRAARPPASAVAVLPESGLVYRLLGDGQWWPLDVLPAGCPLAGPEIDALQVLIACPLAGTPNHPREDADL